MAGFWSQLVSVLRSSKSSNVRRVDARRRLRVELLESRQMMAANITGTVFNDLTENGLDGSDPRLSGVTVALFRDGGNNTFDNGGGDDVSVGTTTSAATTGAYSFTGITTAGRYYVVQTAASGFVQRTSQRIQTIDVTSTDIAGIAVAPIDTFDTTAQLVTATNPGSTPATSSVAAPEAIGGERDIFIDATAGTVSAEVDTPSTTNYLAFNVGAGANGTRIVTYDGADGNATTLNNTGLGGVDLTSSGTASGFRFAIGGEAGTTLTLTINSGANASSVTVNIPVTAGALPTATLDVPFSSFTTSAGTGANFASVGAITLEVAGPDAADAIIDGVSTFGPTVLTTNFANLTPMSIGNQVFVDRNNNGLFDTSATPAETGLAGVQLQLFNDTNNNGTFDSGTDLQVTDSSSNPVTATTDSSGIYLFSNLLPGNYFVVIPAAQFTSGNAAFGTVVSSTVPSGPTNNSNKGTAISGGGVVTSRAVLIAGAAPTTDGDTDANTDLSFDIGLVPQYDLTINKATTATAAAAGSTITYTITARNDGPASATGVVITDDIPDGLQIISATSTTGTDVVTIPPTAQDTTLANPDNITINVGTLAASANTSRTITIVALVLPNAVGSGNPATIVNQASISGVGTELTALTNTSSVSLPVTRNAVLELTKNGLPATIALGNNVTYTLVLRNTGPATATNAVINDTLPAGLDLISVNSSSGTATPTQGTGSNPDSFQVTIPNINVDAPTADTDVTVTVVAQVLSTATGTTITNTATAIADDAAQVSANATNNLQRQIDLVLTKTITTNPASTATPAVATPGSTITYTLLARNDGPSSATTVRLTDNLPDGIRVISATSSDSADVITIPPTAQDTTAANNDDLTVDMGTLAVGASAQTTITVIAVVLPGTTGTFTNTASITTTDTTANSEQNTANNSASVSANAPRTVDLAVTKNGPTTAIAGNTITYTMTATNNGPSDATGVQVTDNIPDGIRVISATLNGSAVTVPASASDTTAANGDDIVFAIGNLASGASNNTITIVAAILPATTAALVNTAVVSTTDTSTVETPTTNNSASVTTTVTSQNDVAISKTGPTTIPAGSEITYTLNVTNTGPSTATNVAVNDPLPSGLTFIAGTSLIGSTTAGTVSANSSNVTSVTIPTLNPGETAVVTIRARVALSQTGSLSNTATVTATGDTNSANNTSSAAATSVTAAVTSTISGRIYLDSNLDNTYESTDGNLAGVLVTLTGTSSVTNTAVTRTTTTDANGQYSFANVDQGTYTIQSAQPSGVNFRASNPGTSGGTAGTRQISAINLTSTASTSNNVGFATFSKRLFLASTPAAQQ